MALTHEERRLVRAYNIGYLMSLHEPKLLKSIIDRNKDNGFVRAMQVGKDHHEFHVNIPRKDYTPAFKNGFYNGRTLAEHDPNMIDRLMAAKGTSKEYKRGLESAKKEYAISLIQKKMDSEPKTPAKDLRGDESFKKGFNIGYRFAERQPFVIDYSKTASERYSKYLDGMKAGLEQHQYDLAKLREKNPEAKIFPDDPQSSVYVDALIDHKIMAMDEISGKQHKLVDRKDTFKDVPEPNWLQKKEPGKTSQALQKGKDKGMEHDI